MYLIFNFFYAQVYGDVAISLYMDVSYIVREIPYNGINDPKGMHWKTLPHTLAQTGYFQLILLFHVLLKGRLFL